MPPLLKLLTVLLFLGPPFITPSDVNIQNYIQTILKNIYNNAMNKIILENTKTFNISLSIRLEQMKISKKHGRVIMETKLQWRIKDLTFMNDLAASRLEQLYLDPAFVWHPKLVFVNAYEHHIISDSLNFIVKTNQFVEFNFIQLNSFKVPCIGIRSSRFTRQTECTLKLRKKSGFKHVVWLPQRQWCNTSSELASYIRITAKSSSSGDHALELLVFHNRFPWFQLALQLALIATLLLLTVLAPPSSYSTPLHMCLLGGQLATWLAIDNTPGAESFSFLDGWAFFCCFGTAILLLVDIADQRFKNKKQQYPNQNDSELMMVSMTQMMADHRSLRKKKHRSKYYNNGDKSRLRRSAQICSFILIPLMLIIYSIVAVLDYTILLADPMGCSMIAPSSQNSDRH